MLNKKINILFFLILILFFILFQSTNFFKNTYNIIYKDHDTRQQYAHDFCKFFGSGYIFYIKKKFKLEKPPSILNSAVNQYWIFPNEYKQIDNNKTIIINYNKNLNFKKNKYKILDNYNDKCFYLEKK